MIDIRELKSIDREIVDMSESLDYNFESMSISEIKYAFTCAKYVIGKWELLRIANPEISHLEDED